MPSAEEDHSPALNSRAVAAADAAADNDGDSSTQPLDPPPSTDRASIPAHPEQNDGRVVSWASATGTSAAAAAPQPAPHDDDLDMREGWHQHQDEGDDRPASFANRSFFVGSLSAGLGDNDGSSPSQRRRQQQQPNNKPSRYKKLQQAVSRHISIVLVLSLHAIIGELLRYSTEIVFADYFFGTTDSGTDSRYSGGALFIDLPPNVLGCFLMGFLCSGDEVLGTAVDVPLAFPKRTSPFQEWTLTHLGLRTGLCGSFTTFASWNAQMVIMLCGMDGTEDARPQVMTALWGYGIGLGMALASYVSGRHAAVALHRLNNPDLAREADAVAEKGEMKALIHRDLPDFERRFLHDIALEEKDLEGTAEGGEDEEGQQLVVRSADGAPRAADVNEIVRGGEGREDRRQQHLQMTEQQKAQHMRHLQQWKETTDPVRISPSSMRDGRRYNSLLRSIERAYLVDEEEPREELLAVARDAGWDVEALQNWTYRDRRPYLDRRGELRKSILLSKSVAKIRIDDEVKPWQWSKFGGEYGSFFDVGAGSVAGTRTEMCITIPLLILTLGLLVWAVATRDGTDQWSHWVREASLSSLFAPFGATLRWRLSRWNGSVRNPRWDWLPIGTLTANMVGCIVSLLCVAFTVRLDDPEGAEYWAGLVLAAIKGGFAGCLSTVSTYAAETVGLLRVLPKHAWGYYYSVGSLLLGCLLGIASYVWAVV